MSTGFQPSISLSPSPFSALIIPPQNGGNSLLDRSIKKIFPEVPHTFHSSPSASGEFSPTSLPLLHPHASSASFYQSKPHLVSWTWWSLLTEPWSDKARGWLSHIKEHSQSWRSWEKVIQKSKAAWLFFTETVIQNFFKFSLWWRSIFLQHTHTHNYKVLALSSLLFYFVSDYSWIFLFQGN